MYFLFDGLGATMSIAGAGITHSWTTHARVATNNAAPATEQMLLTVFAAIVTTEFTQLQRQYLNQWQSPRFLAALQHQIPGPDNHASKQHIGGQAAHHHN